MFRGQSQSGIKSLFPVPRFGLELTGIRRSVVQFKAIDTDDLIPLALQAYADFAGCSADELLAEFPNLVAPAPLSHTQCLKSRDAEVGSPTNPSTFPLTDIKN